MVPEDEICSTRGTNTGIVVQAGRILAHDVVEAVAARRIFCESRPVEILQQRRELFKNASSGLCL